MGLREDIERIAEAASALGGGASLTGVLAAEPGPGRRAYVCAYEAPDGMRSWLVLDGDARPVTDRREARDAVSIAALCEIAAEAAFPGDLDELRAGLVALRITEGHAGIDEALTAAAELERTLATSAPASAGRLDEIGCSALALERALDPTVSSPFAGAMRSAQAVVDELWRDVESSHRVPWVP